MMGYIACLIYQVTEEEKERIKTELEQLEFFSVMVSGVPVDMERMPELENPIGFVNMWRSISK